MKKEIKLSLVILFLICSSNESIGQIDSSLDFTFLEYDPTLGNEYVNARNTVSKNWKINFISIGGCIVTQPIIDRAQSNNKKTREKLLSIYGNNWEEKFKNEVQKELEIQNLVRKLIDDQLYIIQKKDSVLAESGDGLYYVLSPTEFKDEYSAIVCGLGFWEGETKVVVYFDLWVNVKNEKVELLNNVIRLLEIY